MKEKAFSSAMLYHTKKLTKEDQINSIIFNYYHHRSTNQTILNKMSFRVKSLYLSNHYLIFISNHYIAAQWFNPSLSLPLRFPISFLFFFSPNQHGRQNGDTLSPRLLPFSPLVADPLSTPHLFATNPNVWQYARQMSRLVPPFFDAMDALSPPSGSLCATSL